ncbi:MFS general substrate transporter [Linderina pennispora]|uniref:MFS general substrate transporter n=1 Tax=Linderina pennispora TaxID=61395 RepID=A0A1Y1WCL8_9FUNG|nr:MFS general substrate transporter [Linderina pennispora]ORX71297.1 MFS general substrate transporter [Linderina pennispora]
MESKANGELSGRDIACKPLEIEDCKEADVSSGPSEAHDEELPIPPPDTLQGWIVVFGALIALTLTIGTTAAYGVYLQAYKLDEFPDTSTSLLSWIGTLQFSCMCFVGIGVGVLCERVDTRLLCLFGSIVAGLALIIASFCHSPGALLATQGIMFGFGGAFLYVPAVALPPMWFEKYRGLATSVAVAGTGIGGVWQSFAARAMMENVGRGWALRISGLVLIGVCSAISPLLRTRMRPARREKIIDFSVLRGVRFPLLFFTTLLGGGAYYIPIYNFPSYSVIVLGKTQSWGANMSAIIGPINALWLACTGTCLSVLVLWLPFKTVGPYLASVILFGFFSGAIVSLVPVSAASLFGIKRLPSIMGLIMLAYAIGGLISSPPAGAMLDKFGHGTDFTSLIIFAGVLAAASVATQSVLRVVISRQFLMKA